MNVVAVIQARMGSTRLPGKMMFLLDDQPVIAHVIRRVKQSSVLDEIVLATSTKDRDDLLVTEAKKAGVDVYRGSESDVLKRVYDAAAQADADIIVRICADNPLISPNCISKSVNSLLDENVDYVGYTIRDRTLPLGVASEAFTMSSFSMVESGTDQEYEREHVTIFYKENPSLFSVLHLDANDVFKGPEVVNRPDLRLTLDTAADYELLQEIYQNAPRDDRGIIDLHTAIEYVDSNGLASLNANVKPKDPTDDE
jgi:spore coat polysaccharide biosynthesis protein SpsF